MLSALDCCYNIASAFEVLERMKPCGSGEIVMDPETLSRKIKSPITEALLNSEVDKRKQQEDNEKVAAHWLEKISCLIHLSVFGILGVLTRYLLQKLFGPNAANLTSDHSILYLDLPSNMVGSFLMGWWGVEFKDDICQVSNHLAIGLTTGYLGSLTTFSGWNQKMLDLSVDGQWLFSLLGFLIGLFLVAYSIIFGVETAKGFRWLLTRQNISVDGCKWRVNNCKSHFAVAAALLVVLGVLLSASGILLKEEFQSDNGEAQLWLACIVAPLGVWIRWFLARFNGHRGLGNAGILQWIPFGTLLANVSAACVMAVLSSVKKEVNTKTCNIVVTGIQFGLLGCLSTVSTFISEFNSMRESKQPWRAYAYVLITIGISFVLGIQIYSVPVWTNGYN